MSESSSEVDKLNINEDFKKRFHHNKQRIEHEKGKFTRRKSEDSSSSSEEVSEDSEGELDNEVVRDKFIDTLMKLKDEKETKKLLESKTPIFTDDDFAKKRERKKEDKDKNAYTINDALLEVKSDSENDIYSINYKPKKIIEDQTAKNEFIAKAKELDDDDNKSKDDFFDDGGLLIKKKEQKHLIEKTNEEEEKEEDEIDETKITKMTLKDALEKSKMKPSNMKLLKKIWGDDSKLSNDEKFLRNYILSEGWLEKNKNKFDNKQFLLVDQIDEENDSKFDEFEDKFNHRFEEEGGANITTYKRNIDSYRHKDDSRANKRKEKQKRKEEEKAKMQKQIETEGKKKVSEIKEKLDQLEKIAGTEKIKELAKEFDNEEEFDMEKFDKKMNDIFNDEYYNANKDTKQEEENENVEEEQEEDVQSQHEENNLWFYCDNCKKPLKPGKIKYECKTCEDYTLCKSCFKSLNHSHQMKKDKVPIDCIPPDNAEELINNLSNENELICSICKNEIVSSYYYICNEQECSKIKICKTCRGKGKSIHEHKLTKYIIDDDKESIDEEEKDPKAKLEKIIENKALHAVDDVIDGKIASKFHYTKVSKDNSDLTNEMLLLLDDSVLNKYIPIKKIAPYSDYKLPEYKKKAMLKHLEKLLDKKKREMANEYKEKLKTEERNEKLLNNKTKRNKQISTISNMGLSKSEYKKKKRLETYGINE